MDSKLDKQKENKGFFVIKTVQKKFLYFFVPGFF